MCPDPHSIPVDGGNAPKCCVPNAMKHNQEEEEHKGDGAPP